MEIRTLDKWDHQSIRYEESLTVKMHHSKAGFLLKNNGQFCYWVLSFEKASLQITSRKMKLGGRLE